MALLTADDVYNKKFTPTKRRSEGYDQDEVDEFLDEVIATIREQANQKEELQAKLEAAERRIAELTQALDEAEANAAAAPAQVAEPAPEPAVEEQPEPVQPEPVAAAAPAEPAAPAGDPESVAGMLALAQKLYDEHVQNGREEAERAMSDARAEADRLLAEAKGEHDRLMGDARTESDRMLTDARSEADRLVREAEDAHNRTLASLEQEKALLERKIEELQVFERDYRTRLKSFLEKLLSDVDGRGEQPQHAEGQF